MTMLAGFADGVVRVLVFQKKDVEKDQYTRKAKYADSTELVLKQVFKPHTRRVTSMAIDHEGKILATGVSGGGGEILSWVFAVFVNWG